MAKWLMYGATGYSGRRTAQRAASLGLTPVLAGRNAQSVEALAKALSLEWRAFDLSSPQATLDNLSDVDVLLNCAGPFIDTFQPLVEACLETSTDYLDITGEVAVYEALAGYDARAKSADIMVMPGVAFDLVPSDCLGLMLKQKLPDATHLDVACRVGGTLSRGTLKSLLVNNLQGLRARRNGELVSLSEPLVKTFNFGPGSAGRAVDCHAISFGEIIIGWRTTGIPNITSYVSPADEATTIIPAGGVDAIAELPEGPSDEELATILTYISAEARNDRGDVVKAVMTTPQVYAITFDLAAKIADEVARGKTSSGFRTPAEVFGADYILGFDRCAVEWL